VGSRPLPIPQLLNLLRIRCCDPFKVRESRFKSSERVVGDKGTLFSVPNSSICGLVQLSVLSGDAAQRSGSLVAAPAGGVDGVCNIPAL
jgi:hypothetical protein